MVSLAALVMKEPSHHITFMCIPSLFDKVHKEFVSHFPDKTTEEIGELVTSVQCIGYILTAQNLIFICIGSSPSQRTALSLW